PPDPEGREGRRQGSFAPRSAGFSLFSTQESSTGRPPMRLARDGGDGTDVEGRQHHPWGVWRLLRADDLPAALQENSSRGRIGTLLCERSAEERATSIRPIVR